jgi:hypothetical protein
MSFVYKNKSNNNYMNICQNCIELKKDNEILNTKITCLEYDNEDLKQEIKDLKYENKDFKQRIIILEYENKELKAVIVKLKDENNKHNFNKLKYKIITAIQDINSHNNLEKIIIIKKSLFKLRKYRNCYNHYIDEDSDNYEIQCKQLYLLYKLKELNNDEKISINNIFSKDEDLINEIINYLDDNIDKNININEEMLDDINTWWEF